jgi:predicted ABC-class ATPase
MRESPGHGRSTGSTRPRAFLEDWCIRLDGGPYSAYRDLLGSHRLRGCDLEVLRVQPDPFAGPSRVRLLVPWEQTGLPTQTAVLPGGRGAVVPGQADRDSARAVGLRDFIGRRVGRWLEENRSGGRFTVSIEPHGQCILDRSAVLFHPTALEIRLAVELPARGRRILGREAARLLLDLPERLLGQGLAPGAIDPATALRHAQAIEDYAALQANLAELGWIAFIADGARLARRAGNDDRPLTEGPVVEFEAPPALRREVSLPHAGKVTGLALDPGVILLCGGGFHGKSTLLRALAAAVVPHIFGDGRERVAARADAVSVRAEEGRSVHDADLRPFLHDLPFGRPAHGFSTENASGSTSQAAAILEAMQGGSRLLLIDEDNSATNFMIRDRLMERLLASRQEPITPFLHRARGLHLGLGVSSILVIGGSGEYFRAADRVLLLDTYRAEDRTEQARAIAHDQPPLPEDPAALELFRAAADPEGRILPPGPPGEPRIRAHDTRRLSVDRVSLDLAGIESLREPSQARFLAAVLSRRLREQGAFRGSTARGDSTPAGLLSWYLRVWEKEGFEGFEPGPRGDCAAVRPLDLLAAANRLRSRPAPEGNWAMEDAQ